MTPISIGDDNDENEDQMSEKDANENSGHIDIFAMIGKIKDKFKITDQESLVLKRATTSDKRNLA